MVKTVYTQKMDAALNYVKNMNLPKDTQNRVRTWFIYNWQQQKVIGNTLKMIVVLLCGDEITCLFFIKSCQCILSPNHLTVLFRNSKDRPSDCLECSVSTTKPDCSVIQNTNK